MIIKHSTDETPRQTQIGLRIARVVSIGKGTVDVCPVGSSVVLHDIPVTSATNMVAGDIINLQIIDNRRFAFASQNADASSSIVTNNVTIQNGDINIAGEGGSGLGTITGVSGGYGLTGSGNSGAVVLDVGAGNGISVDTNSVSVNALSNGGISVGANGVYLASSIAGDGLNITSGVLDVDSTVVRTTRTISAGNGLTGGGSLAANLSFAVQPATGSAIVVDSTGVFLNSSLAGNGLSMTSQVLDVNPGNGIQITGDAVAINLATTSGLNTTSGLAIDDSIAGSGIGITSKVLSVAANTSISDDVPSFVGLQADADGLRIYASSKPGEASHILASTSAGKLQLPLFEAETSVTTPAVTSGSGVSLNITSGTSGDIILTPASGLTKITSGTSIQSNGYASQTTGMRISHAGEGDFRYIYADELHAKSFIADLEQALAGGQIISKSVTSLSVNYVLPAAGVSSSFTANDLPSAKGMRVFETGDFIGFRVIDRSAGSLTIGWAWGTVSAYIDNLDGTQTWTFTRSASPNAGIASGTVYKDAIILDFGKSGNGYHEVNAIDGLQGSNSPYSQIVTWATNPANRTVRTRLGNLRGIFGVTGSSVYSLAIESATGGTFIIQVGDVATSSIAYNASAATVQSAINAIISGATVALATNGSINTYTITITSAYSASPFSVNAKGITGTTSLDVRCTLTSQTNSEFGLYAGSGTSTSSRYIRASDTVVELRNTPLSLYAGANETMRLSSGSSNNSPSMAMGYPLPSGPLSNDDGVWMGLHSSEYKLRIGAADGSALTNGIYWNGSTLTVTGAINVLAGGNAATTSYVDAIVSPTTGKLAFAVVAAPTGGAGLYLGSSYLGYYNNGWQTYMDNSGNFLLRDLAGAAGAAGVRFTASTGIFEGGFYAAGTAPTYGAFTSQWATSAATGAITAAGGKITIDSVGITLKDSDLTTVRAAMGNLNGKYGYATAVYGIAVGDPSSQFLSADSVNGIRIMDGANARFQVDGSGNLSINNTSGVKVIAMDQQGNLYLQNVLTINSVGGLYSGTGTFASPTTGLKMWSTVVANQTLTYTVTATGGTFTITVNSVTTPAQPYNQTAALLQTAITTLTTVGTGNATVTKVGTVFTITFVGLKTGIQHTVSANSASLTGGTGTLVQTAAANLQGRIGGYNGGVVQWYADTDGILKAGGGKVRLDSSGATIESSTIYDAYPNGINWSVPNVSHSRTIHFYTSTASGISSAFENSTFYMNNINAEAGSAINITSQAGASQTTYNASITILSQRSSSFGQLIVRQDGIFLTGSGLNVGSATGAVAGEIKASGNASANNGVFTGGLNVGSTTLGAGNGDIAYTGDLTASRTSNYTGYIYVPNTAYTNLTDGSTGAGTQWSGAATRAVGTYQINLNATANGLNASIKAVVLAVRGSWTTASTSNRLNIREWTGTGTGGTNQLIITAQAANIPIDNVGVVNVGTSSSITVEVAGASVSSGLIRVIGYYI